MYSAGLTHRGVVRKNNEDSIFSDDKLGLFIVADGIGGEEAGEIASSTAVRIIADHMKDNISADIFPSVDILKEAFFAANHAIYSEGKADIKKNGMGTTMTAALVDENHIYLVHVGDSRAYFCHQDSFKCLTNDHSLAGELVRDGSITQEEAAHHPQKNILTRALGHEPLVQVDDIEIQWQHGDYLLLCSDGLYNLLENKELEEIILDDKTNLPEKAQIFIDMALQRGGYDNISVVLVCNN
ncbi:MAG: Stp1/IreP family PP2C-type Ser/Thr phosphatase [Clostridiales bacterium]